MPKIVSHADRLRELCTAVAHENDLRLHQWCHLYALALDFQPDCIIELGRGYGNSTCLFTEAAHTIGDCRVTSFCRSRDWWTRTLPRLRPFVTEDWLRPLDAQVADLAKVDFRRTLENARRVLVFWDAHGFDVAEIILARLMPLLIDKPHFVAMHDVSDARYCVPSPHSYEGKPIWRGQDLASDTARLRLGWIDTCVEQTIAVVDFLSRNGLELQSADHDIAEDLVHHPALIAEIESTYPRDCFARVNHWAYFTLGDGGRPRPVFPSVLVRQDPPLPKGVVKLQKRLRGGRAALGRAVSAIGKLTGARRDGF